MERDADPRRPGAWPVVASVQDAAGNVGRASQILTIAPITPVTPGGAGTPLTPRPRSRARALSPGSPHGGGGSINAAATATVAGSAQTAGPGVPALDRHEGDRPRRGPVVATATGTVKIRGLARAIKLTRASRTVAAGPERDADAQADGRQEGGSVGVPEDQGCHEG